MANIEYSYTFTYGMEQGWQTQPGVHVTTGSWTQERTDRVLPVRVQSFGYKSPGRESIYPPLPSDVRATRVLRLDPGKSLDVLRGSLEQCILADTGPSVGYMALSYVWGDSTERGEVLINGQSIHITSNLDRVLRQVRHEEVPVTLWADGICVNQEDLSELSEQVRIMVNIFTAASRVFAWLGPETERTVVGMHVLRYLLECAPGAERAPWELLPFKLLRAGIADINDRAYFKRMWVVQEASLAAEVELACGSHSIVWKNSIEVVRRFERSVKLAAISPQWQSMRLPDLSGFLQLLVMQLDTSRATKAFDAPRQQTGILDVIYELRHREAADPRDRYYAVLGIIGSRQAALLKPDYTLSAAEVYRQVIKLVLQEDFPQLLDTVASPPASCFDNATRMSALGTRSIAECKAQLENVRMGTFNDVSGSGALDEYNDIYNAQDEALQRRSILIAQVEATCSRAVALIARGNTQEAAVLLANRAKGVGNS
ncbi:hypothetical protein LTR17_020558 [Elasticomyces elasticus]|nr:hypothetical protein LTR17_020558 [Elasticomyces elasticus]